MKITVDGLTKEIYNPELSITVSYHQECQVSLSFITYPGEQFKVFDDLFVYQKKDITIENGSNLFVLHDAFMSNIVKESVLGVSVNDSFRIKVEFYVKNIDCQNLNDCFVE